MPKKKTGQRKKAEKQKLRQKEIRTAKDNLDLAQVPCNAAMECEKCHRYVLINFFNFLFNFDFQFVESRKVVLFVISVKVYNDYLSVLIVEK